MLSRMKSILKRKGYTLYTRPFELNIVGLRSNQTRANRFDDEIHVFYRANNKLWHYHVFKATTDPGTFWLKNPMAPQGTAILTQGQYKGAYQLGLHQGKYPALVQRLGKVRIIRDYDRNGLLDFNSGRVSTGFFGINIHRASVSGSTLTVDKYSAGCQVFQNPQDFDKFMALCRMHSSLYGNQFTYTLIDFRAIKRETYRRYLYVLVGAMMSLGGLVYFYYEEPEQQKKKGKKKENKPIKEAA